MTDKKEPTVPNIIGVMEAMEKRHKIGVVKRRHVLDEFPEESWQLVSEVIELIINMSKDKKFVAINKKACKFLCGLC